MDLDYDGGRWKRDALGSRYMRNLLVIAQQHYPYPDTFPTSDWKLFHDAARCQRHDVFVQVLPRFGIMEN